MISARPPIKRRLKKALDLFAPRPDDEEPGPLAPRPAAMAPAPAEAEPEPAPVAPRPAAVAPKPSPVHPGPAPDPRPAPVHRPEIRALAAILEREGIARGALLDVGAAPFLEADDLPDLAKTLLGPDRIKEMPAHYRAVIEGEPEFSPGLAPASFDVIVVGDLLRRIERPWDLARNLTRLLRPGGVLMVETVLSDAVRPEPVDYWRFTPEGLATLFEGLETIDSRLDPPDPSAGGTVRVVHAARRPVLSRLTFGAPAERPAAPAEHAAPKARKPGKPGKARK